MILLGSILNSEFDWEACRGKVARILNEIAPNDQWVKFMPNSKWLVLDSLFGRSGVDGFSKKSEILFQSRNDIFDHHNVIKRDIIEKKWMPFLNANRFALHEELKHLFKDLKK